MGILSQLLAESAAESAPVVPVVQEEECTKLDLPYLVRVHKATEVREYNLFEKEHAKNPDDCLDIDISFMQKEAASAVTCHIISSCNWFKGLVEEGFYYYYIEEEEVKKWYVKVVLSFYTMITDVMKAYLDGNFEGANAMCIKMGNMQPALCFILGRDWLNTQVPGPSHRSLKDGCIVMTYAEREKAWKENKIPCDDGVTYYKDVKFNPKRK